MTEPWKPKHPIDLLEVGLPGEEWVDKVYLDGVEQTGVLAASETKGYVVRYELNEDGTIRMNAFGDEAVAEKVEGDVTITLRDARRREEL